MTTAFVDAAELMGHVLGFGGYEFATIEHPISSASPQGLQERALAVVEQIEQLLLNDSR